MDRSGSSNRATDVKNEQGKHARDTSKTRGDATTEQTPPESRMRRVAHFLGKAVFYTSAAKALFDSTICPASAKGLSHNDQYALRMEDDHGAQPSQRGMSHSSLESRRGSSSVDSPSGYMGKGHDEFSLMVRIGDYEFIKPTGEDIKVLLQDKDFPKYLGIACKNPQGFTDLLKNDAFLDMISPMYQDKNVQNFMFSLCKNPRLQADFLKLKKEVSNTLIERQMDAILDQFGDDGYDKKRKIDNLQIQKNQQYLMKMMYNMQDIMKKMLDQQHEKDKMQYKKDKMRISQDKSEKERLFYSREYERQRTREVEGKAGLLLLAGTVILATYVCKCTNKSEKAEEKQWMPRQIDTEEYWRIREYYRRTAQQHEVRVFGDYSGENVIEQKINYIQNDQQIEQDNSLRYRKKEGKQLQIEATPENSLKIEEIKEEESKTESSYDQGKRKYSEQEMMEHSRANLEILNDKKSLLKLFEQGRNEHINNLFYYCGSKNVVKKILDLGSEDKKFILRNEQFQMSLCKSKKALDYLYDNKQALKDVKKYGGKELAQRVEQAIFNRKAEKLIKNREI